MEYYKTFCVTSVEFLRFNLATKTVVLDILPKKPTIK